MIKRDCFVANAPRNDPSLLLPLLRGGRVGLYCGYLMIFSLILLIVGIGCEKTSTIGDVSTPDLKIGRMKVSLWPEYDTQGVLVIYEGKFADKDRFPAKASFIFPKGVKELTDACSLSPKGQHFCQLYEVLQKEDYSEATLKLPYADFFIDFQYNPFPGGEKREFEYSILSKYSIGILEVNVQQPLRSSEFNVTPASLAGGGQPGNETQDKGFRYLHYTYENVPEGKEIKFFLSYNKQDSRPSVDIKFSSMAQRSKYSSKRGFALLLVGGLLFLVLLGYYRYNSAKRCKMCEKPNSSETKKEEGKR